MSSPANADNKIPEVSIIMAVHNGAEHIHAAVESIFSQSFADFEFIIIDDGSSDSTPAILRSCAERDPRIVLISQNNMGLTKSLNKGLKLAKGKYIARQDADDVSYPYRIERQVARMDADSALVLIGGRSDDMHDDGLKTTWPYHDDRLIQKIVYFKAPFPHSTAMMRADTCRKLGGYDEGFRTAQDMDLWMRMANTGGISMLDESILLRRVGAGSISVKRRWRQFYDAFRARIKHGSNPALAIYHSVRSIVIALLPVRLIAALKEYRS
jgi:glycosyltransferase involved in cell wall biosynthesis